MNKFVVSVQEHSVKYFEIEAENMEDAIDLAKNKYKNGESKVDLICDDTTRLVSGYDANIYHWTDWVEF